MSTSQYVVRLRPEIEAFEAYTAGLNIEEIKARYGLSRVIKLASNENPLGTSPLAKKAIERHAGLAFRYPQAGAPRLAAALAVHLGVEPERIILGNGSDEVIDLLIRVLARPGAQNIVACKPCFSIYELQAKLSGVEFRQAPLTEDFTVDWDALVDLCDENTAVCFVTSPDNPSGRWSSPDELAALAGRLPETCLLAVDEAYVDFVDPPASLLSRLGELPNVVLLRTFSKAYGLAGLRLGYGVAPAILADACKRVRLPFSVNLLAEEAGLAALEDSVFLEETIRVTLAGRERLTSGLQTLGCRVWPSQANFLLVKPPHDGPSARQIFENLLRRGVIVRPLASYGLDRHLRVSIGNAEENEVFLREMEAILG